MNEHLLPVYNLIFPSLREENILFWVHGGVAVASIRGEYLRKNGDIDVFVEEEYFGKTKEILEQLCMTVPEWKLSYTVLGNIRPKVEIYSGREEIFSLIPVYKNEDNVKFVFPNGGSRNFPSDILSPVKRILNGFEFNSVPDKYIKELFYNHYNLLLKRNYEGSHMKNYIIDKEYLDSLENIQQ